MEPECSLPCSQELRPQSLWTLCYNSDSWNVSVYCFLLRNDIWRLIEFVMLRKVVKLIKMNLYVGDLCKCVIFFIHGALLSPRHRMSSFCGWRNSLHVWRLVVGISNKWSWTATNVWSSSLGLGVRLTTFYHKKCIVAKNNQKASEPDSLFEHRVLVRDQWGDLDVDGRIISGRIYGR